MEPTVRATQIGRSRSNLAIGSVILMLSGVVAGLSATSAAASGSVLAVPGDYPTIQAAIDASQNGDTVSVAQGTYFERINFRGKSIKVKSVAGAAATVIDGEGAGPVVRFITAELRDALLKGFTIQHGFADGSSNGIASGGGVFVRNSYPTIKKNIIQDNAATYGGGGISAEFSGPLITKNIIQRNGRGILDGIGGGGVFLGGSGSAAVTHNLIQDNASTDGGGILMNSAGSPVITNNVILRNRAEWTHGGGVAASNRADGLLLQNLIVENTARGDGGGLYWSVPDNTRGPYVVNNTLSGNQAPKGSAVVLKGFDADSTFVNNIAASGSTGAVMDCGDYPLGTVPVIAFNNVTNQAGPLYGGNCSDATGVNGNISADPRFVDAGAGDYHLRATSASIDAGDTSQPELGPTDLDGLPRVIGDSVDQGAYETQPGADLSVSLTASPSPVRTGKTLSWTVTITNHGPQPATGVELADDWSNQLPGGVQFRSVSASQGVCDFQGETTVHCSLGELAANDLAIVTIAVKPRGRGTLTNTATVTAVQPDTDTTNNNASVPVEVLPA